MFFGNLLKREKRIFYEPDNDEKVPGSYLK